MHSHIKTLRDCVCKHHFLKKFDLNMNPFDTGEYYRYRLEHNLTKNTYSYRVYYEENNFVKFNLQNFTLNFQTLEL